MKKRLYIFGAGLLAIVAIAVTILVNLSTQKADVTPIVQAKITPISTVITTLGQTDFSTSVPYETSNNPPTEFYGEWKNAKVNPDIKRVLIQSKDGRTYINMFGTCVPTDCNWQEFSPTPTVNYNYVSETGILNVQWTFDFIRTTQEIILTLEGQLKITSQHHFLDNSGRADYQTVQYFKRL